MTLMVTPMRCMRILYERAQLTDDNFGAPPPQGRPCRFIRPRETML
jgi:hypothetical protein